MLELFDGLGFAVAGTLLIYAIPLTLDSVREARGSNLHLDLLEVGEYIRKVLAVIVIHYFSFSSISDFKTTRQRANCRELPG